MGIFSEIFTFGLIASTISLCSPLVICSLGGLISDKSGIPNIALEGIMSAGAFCAVVFYIPFESPWLATIIAGLIGGLIAFILSLICIKGRGDAIISGFAVNFICWGILPVISMQLFNAGMTPRVKGFSTGIIQFIKNIPFLGDIFQRNTILTYLGLIVLPLLISILMYRTRFGKHITATGLDPFSADTKGINVFRVRYIALILSGILAAIAGADLSLGIVSRWTSEVVAGRGFMAIAAYMAGRRKPLPTLGICFAFAFLQALSTRLQLLNLIRSEVIQILPYIITIIILGIIGKGEFTSFAKPYYRE